MKTIDVLDEEEREFADNIDSYRKEIDAAYQDGYNEGVKVTLEKQGEKIDVIENFDTEFEKQVSRLIASAINKEHEYNEGFVKWTANALLNYAKHELEKQGEQKQKQYDIDVLEKHITKDSISELAHTVIVRNGWEIVDAKEQKPAWSEEDERIKQDIENLIHFALRDGSAVSPAADTTKEDAISWMQSLKDRVQPQPKREWSEEDDKIWRGIIAFIIISTIGCDIEGFKTWIDWLKALKERYI